MDGTVTNLLSTSVLGLGFISLGAPDLAVYQLSTLRPPPAPLHGPAPAFVSACHLPGNQTKRIREKHKARTQICPQILSHTFPRREGTAHAELMDLEKSGFWSCLGDHRNYSSLFHSAPLTKRADLRKNKTPLSVFLFRSP